MATIIPKTGSLVLWRGDTSRPYKLDYVVFDQPIAGLSVPGEPENQFRVPLDDIETWPEQNIRWDPIRGENSRVTGMHVYTPEDDGSTKTPGIPGD